MNLHGSMYPTVVVEMCVVHVASQNKVRYLINELWFLKHDKNTLINGCTMVSPISHDLFLFGLVLTTFVFVVVYYENNWFISDFQLNMFSVLVLCAMSFLPDHQV